MTSRNVSELRPHSVQKIRLLPQRSYPWTVFYYYVYNILNDKFNDFIILLKKYFLLINDGRSLFRLAMNIVLYFKL